MNIDYFAVLYIVIAVVVSTYAFVQGVLTRPRPRVFTLEDQVLLALATLAVGAFWILFLPVTLAAWVSHGVRWLSRRENHWSLPFPREARIR